MQNTNEKAVTDEGTTPRAVLPVSAIGNIRKEAEVFAANTPRVNLREAFLGHPDLNPITVTGSRVMTPGREVCETLVRTRLMVPGLVPGVQAQITTGRRSERAFYSLRRAIEDALMNGYEVTYSMERIGSSITHEVTFRDPVSITRYAHLFVSERKYKKSAVGVRSYAWYNNAKSEGPDAWYKVNAVIGDPVRKEVR